MATLNQAIEQPGNFAGDVDANTRPQEADEDELLSPDQLASVAAGSTSTGTPRTWLRRNSLNQALNYQYPKLQWLVGWENWVYLLLVVLVAGGLWWHFKKS
jgi:hypothetical protein